MLCRSTLLISLLTVSIERERRDSSCQAIATVMTTDTLENS
jgi:hypothetical protein